MYTSIYTYICSPHLSTQITLLTSLSSLVRSLCPSPCLAGIPESTSTGGVSEFYLKIPMILGCLKHYQWLSAALCLAFCCWAPWELCYLFQVSCATSPAWSHGVCSRFCWRSMSGRWTRQPSSVTSCWPCWSCSQSAVPQRLSVCSTPGCTPELMLKYT